MADIAHVTQSIVEVAVLPIVPGPPGPPAGPAGGYGPGQGIAPVGGTNPVNGLGPMGGLPSAITAQQAAVLASLHSKGGCTPHITHYDWCLEAEAQLLRLIKFPLPCSIPEEYLNYLPWDEDNRGAIPPQSVPFLQQKGIVTPTTASGDNVVLTFRVPYGFDALLAGFYFNYSGSGFAQGSGDILWRIQVNQYYLKDLSNLPFLLGDPVNPVPMTQGKILFSGQKVSAIVNVPNLSGMIQIGNSTVYAGLLGFWWPR